MQASKQAARACVVLTEQIKWCSNLLIEVARGPALKDVSIASLFRLTKIMSISFQISNKSIIQTTQPRILQVIAKTYQSSKHIEDMVSR